MLVMIVIFLVILASPSMRALGQTSRNIWSSEYSNITGPAQPDFNLFANPASLTVHQGGSATSEIVLSSISSFSGDVHLTAMVVPDLINGTSALLNLTQVTLIGNSTTASSLSIYTTPVTLSGAYQVTVTGFSASTSHSVQVVVTVESTPFSFRDDFNYSSLDELSGAGWRVNPLAPMSLYSVGDGELTLRNDGSAGAEVEWSKIPSGVGDWTVALRGKWVGNSVGTIQINVVTAGHTYFWFGDGLNRELRLLRDVCCEPVFRVSGYQPELNVWHEFRLDMQSGILSMFFDNNLAGTYEESDPVTDLTTFGTQGSWLTDDSFDFITAAQLVPQTDFTIELNPTTLTLVSGESGTSTISLTSKADFSGDVHLSAVAVPPTLTATVSPDVITLTGGRTATSTLTVSSLNSTFSGSFGIMVEASADNITHTASLSVTLLRRNASPIASFIFFPTDPIVGDLVSFNGSNSSDSDGFLTTWFWTFGDGDVGFGPFTAHSYQTLGDYRVTLTVTDNDGANAVATVAVHVRPRPTHDVAIISVRPQSNVAVAGQHVGIELGLANNGLVTETVDVTVYFNSQVAAALHGITLPASARLTSDSTMFLGPGIFAIAVWHTDGVSPGNYTISATVLLTNDENTHNNSLQDGLVSILPPPTLTVTPNRGPLGTKVVVQGSGFPSQPYSPAFGQVLVTFDDMFTGISIVKEGGFSFTFNVPHAELGLHQVKAFDTLSGIRVSTDFQVTDSHALPSKVDVGVAVDVGTIYFPGDSADIFVLVSVDGIATSSPVEIMLIKPDHTSVTLTSSEVSNGVYRATFSIPRAASLGTYVVLAKATLRDSSGSAIKTFEVKQSWLSQQTPRIISALALVGIIAGVVVAWNRGYFRRRVEDSSGLP